MSVPIPFLLVVVIILLIVLFRIVWIEISRPTYISSELCPLDSLIYLNDDLQWTVRSRIVLTYSKLGFKGNTGNQLFELATLIALAKRHHAQIYLPPHVKTLPLTKMFDLSGIPQRDLSGYPQFTLYEWDNYEEIILTQPGIYNLTGYRQCPKYFEEIKPGLLQLFRPHPEQLKLVRDHLKVTGQWMGLHIRRGDLLQWLSLNQMCPSTEGMSLITLNYYRAAIRTIRKEYHLPENTPVIIMTDDPDWVRPRLSQIDRFARLNEPKSMIDPKIYDFLTLYLAPYVVLANSTFSWWAGYLGHHQVIAPWPWFSPHGIIPSSLNIVRFPIYDPSWTLLEISSGKVIENNLTLEDAQINSGLIKVLRGYITA